MDPNGAKSMVEAFPEARYCVLDTETTGLNKQTDELLEIAWMLCDEDYVPILKPHAYGSVFVKCDRPSNTWTAHDFHSKTGFLKRYTEACAAGKCIDANSVDLALSLAVRQDVILIGNNAEGFDIHFLLRQMPRLAAKFKYFIINVSSTREVYCTARKCSRYKVKESFAYDHSAFGDVIACHRELLFYRALFMKL